MPLNVGSRLGHYDVTALIGEGGMGQVYQATDTKLNRQVALKILPEAFATDPDRLARFQREAQVLASLNHPGIAAIYGLEESDDTRALVLELVEGPTLADRIAQGPIPIDEALPIAKQIAEALEAAHEAGVIHRDLKPANIKVRDDGTVKVLDFGLAKALDTAPEGDPSLSPTLTAAATQMGVIMGTAAYMSPEQARGKVVDKKADIWAFGAVLFEMLTGSRAFEGEDVSATLANVINQPPDWKRLPGGLSPSLPTYLRRCLEKEPKQRIPDIADMRLAMEGAFETAVSAQSDAARSRPAGWRQALPLALGVAAVVAIITSVMVWSLRRPVSLEPTRLSVAMPTGVTYRNDGIALSPDGQTLVFAAEGEDGSQLYRRPLGSFVATPIAGTENAFDPFFSPDGTSVVFFSPGETVGLRTVSLDGGRSFPLADDLDFANGLSWGPDGAVVYSAATGLFRVSARGGEPELLVPNPAPDLLRWPDVLPDGSAALVTLMPASLDSSAAQVGVVSLATGELDVLFRGRGARYSPSGHIVYYREGSLWAVPFDVNGHRVVGAETPVVEGVRSAGMSGRVHFALSATGTLAYVSGGGTGLGQLGTVVWVDEAGNEEPLAGVTPRDYRWLRVSPDGQRVVIDETTGNLWLYDLETQVEQEITFSGDDRWPIWSPDGREIIFTSTRDGPANLYRLAANLSGEVTRLTDSPAFHAAYDWFDDGNSLLIVTFEAVRSLVVVDVARGSDAEVVPLITSEAFRDQDEPTVSPDGGWLAYTLDGQVYVRPFPNVNSGQPQQVSPARGEDPLWGPNGDELFYRGPDGVMAVDVTTGEAFSRGTPRVLFPDPYFRRAGTAWDISSDGQRFLMIKLVSRAGADALLIVQHFFEELKRIVPVD